jgi:hypothetical protein
MSLRRFPISRTMVQRASIRPGWITAICLAFPFIFGLITVTGLPAVEFDRDLVKRCLGNVVTEFSVDVDDELIQTEVEVDTDEDIPSERFRIQIRMDGRTIYNGTKRTNAVGEINIRNVRRSDSRPRLFIARVTRVDSGESCELRIRAPR